MGILMDRDSILAVSRKLRVSESHLGPVMLFSLMSVVSKPGGPLESPPENGKISLRISGVSGICLFIGLCSDPGLSQAWEVLI